MTKVNRTPSPITTSTVLHVAESARTHTVAQSGPGLTGAHGISTLPHSPSTAERKVRLELERQEAENSYLDAALVQAGPSGAEELKKRRHRRDESIGTLGTVMKNASDLNRLQEQWAASEADSGEVPEGRRAFELSDDDARPWLSRQGAECQEVPMIPQGRPNACGDACMEMVLAYFNRQHAPEGSNDRPFYQGLKLGDIESALEEKELLAARLKPSKEGDWRLEEIAHFTGMYGPLIAVGHGHFVVITGIDSDSVAINDPLLGKRKITAAQLNKWIDQEAEVSVLGFSQTWQSLNNVEEQASLPGPDSRSRSAPGVTDRAMVSLMRAASRLRP